MATAWGANPDELDALASAMQRAAATLARSSGEVNFAFRQDIWRGDDAQRARAQWDGSLHRQLQKVSEALSASGGMLRQHAQAQVAASAAADSSGVQSGFGKAENSSGAGSVDGVEPQNWIASLANGVGWASLATSSVGMAAYLASYAGRVGDYKDLYRGLTPSVGGNLADIPDFFRFKKSPILQSLDVFSNHNGAFKTTTKLVEESGKWLGYAGLGLNTGSAVTDLVDGEYADAGITTAGIVGDVLKNSKNPLAYMAGAATSAVAMAVEEGMKVDWSPEAVSMTNDFAHENPLIVVEEVAKATCQLPLMLARVFL